MKPSIHKPRRIIQRAASVLGASARHPGASIRDVANLPARVRAEALVRNWQANSQGEHTEADNPLRAIFDGVAEGPGVWKWLHYFDVYHRHLSKFVGRSVTVVEVGVYSGGSMAMWRRYFGDQCHVHGVDIEPGCLVYGNAFTTIYIGDQADRGFWRRFRQSVPGVDVLIDDGGHASEQQTVTLEEMLPALNPGGVYICEDILRVNNSFAQFVHSLAAHLNYGRMLPDAPELASTATPFQSDIASVCLYPFMAVIEKTSGARRELRAEKHGTQWQPFYERTKKDSASKSIDSQEVGSGSL